MDLYGAAFSRTRRVLWTMAECGAEFRFHKVDLGRGEARTPAYLAMNPNGRVPTLVDGDLVLFESAAICTYIADRHPEAALIPPPGTPEKARHDQWMFWVCTELEQALWSMGKHRFALPAQYRIPEMMRTALWEYERAAQVLSAALEGRPHLLGERFGLVDIMAGHTLSWARAFSVPLGSPVLEAYADRVLSRPGFLATRAYE